MTLSSDPTRIMHKMVKVTGLYYLDDSVEIELRRFRKCIVFSRVGILFMANVFFTMLVLARVFLNMTLMTWNRFDLEYLLLTSWQIQSFLSVLFFMQYQRNGSMSFIFDVIRKNAHHRSLRKSTVQYATICILMSIFFVMIMCFLIGLRMNANTIKQAWLGLHRYDFLYTVIRMYGFAVRNVVFCLFMVAVRAITVELERYNADFEQHFRQPASVISGGHVLSNYLVNSLLSHNELSENILRIDKIFQTYTIFMMVLGTPTTIFTLIILIHRKPTAAAIFTSSVELLLCTIHLIGLTIIPAQVYSQARQVSEYIHRNKVIWSSCDTKVYQLANAFMTSVHQSNVGITIGSYVTITKSLILKFTSFAIPYIILCLQLRIGAESEWSKSSSDVTVIPIQDIAGNISEAIHRFVPPIEE
ncbi:CBR-GUR-5 protein [Ditylenchus destructor]|uniref:CBR-GUR-5 protein n=1 Tax=Ditylenchus destructor TaxID=166010 RepID=A0AAD4MVH7_9BILA|nr:CBR-GUR-5 protein [Ditylenchus destructor]